MGRSSSLIGYSIDLNLNKRTSIWNRDIRLLHQSGRYAIGLSRLEKDGGSFGSGEVVTKKAIRLF